MKYKYTDYRLGLASNIKHYRLKAGYTQEQLAEKVGIGSKHLSRIETARVGVSLDMLVNIADALGVDAYKLLMFH